MKALVHWAVEFLKNKDLFDQKITGITEEDDMSVCVEYKDRTLLVITAPSLENLEGLLNNLKNRVGERRPVLVTLNTKKNYLALADNFKQLVNFHKMLQVIVVNPKVEMDQKWIIYPYTHSKIADPESLKKGIKSMFDTVAEVSEKDAHEFL